MPVIDTRLADIQNLQKKYSEIYRSQPVLAQELAQKAAQLQQSLSQDMAPLNKLLEPWTCAS